MSRKGSHMRKSIVLTILVAACVVVGVAPSWAQATSDTVEVVRPVAPGENVVRFDEDVAAGAAIAPRGRPLRAQSAELHGRVHRHRGVRVAQPSGGCV